MIRNEPDAPIESTALVANAPGAGWLQLTDDQFEHRLAEIETGQARVALAKKRLMKEGTHWGTIPGTKKPTLFKAGAEVLAHAFQLRAAFRVVRTYGNGETSPPISVHVECKLHVGDLEGPVVAVGIAAANSWEKRYRYRKAERACPACGVVGSIIKGNPEFGGGWVCWKKRGGCGAKFDDADPKVVGQDVGQEENPDPMDLENTLVKMGKKRAFIDAVLTGTASSDLFTQDLEDLAGAGAPAGPQPAATREPGDDVEAAPLAAGTSGCPHCGSADFVVSRNGKTAVCSDCSKGWNL